MVKQSIQRVRRHTGLREDQLHQRPMIIVVTKWDSWRSLLPDVADEPPFVEIANASIKVLDGHRIENVSKQVGDMLREYTTEIVAAAEGFASSVSFLPVSATGHSPELDPSTGSFGIRPRDLSPYWVEVPMLYSLSRWGSGMIGMSSAAALHRSANPKLTKGNAARTAVATRGYRTDQAGPRGQE